MKHNLMIAASVLALAIAAPAMAQNATMDTQADASVNANVQTDNNIDTPQVGTVTEGEIERGWNNTKDTVSGVLSDVGDTVSDTADSVADTAGSAYENATAAFDTKVDVDAYVENEATLTASKLIDAGVLSAEGEEIATIEDILVDANGQVQGAIVSNGGFLGVAEKKTLVDFSQLGNRDAEGRFVTSLTEKALDATPAYNANAAAGAEGQFRLSSLMDAAVTNPADEDVAAVENIVIENGMATKLVVSYMDGLVPKDAMLDFTDAELQATQDNEATFRLSMSEATDFNQRTGAMQ